MSQRGDFGLISSKTEKVNLDNFEKGQWIYLCCCNYGCYNSMVGKGGMAASPFSENIDHLLRIVTVIKNL